MARRTTNAFPCELTGAFPVKMIVRRRADSGVFSHSSSVINSCACQAVPSGTVRCMRPGTKDQSLGQTHLVPAAVVDMPDVVNLLLDVGKVFVEVGKRVQVFHEGMLDVGHCGTQSKVCASLALLRGWNERRHPPHGDGHIYL